LTTIMMRDPIQGLLVPALTAHRATPGGNGRSHRRRSPSRSSGFVAWYWRTGAGMVDIWIRSETFAHGFLVAPISLWLVWRARGRCSQTAPRPSWAVARTARRGRCLLAARRSRRVNALAQFAFVAMLFSRACGDRHRAAAAHRVSARISVLRRPIGEFLMPQLMEWTADFTLPRSAERHPVFREGQNFVIPSGRWSVVEACSGVRYLIASLVVGTLYAYLTYRSTSAGSSSSDSRSSCRSSPTGCAPT
jgi:exosortase